MHVNPDFKVFLFESDNEPEPEVEPQYEPGWDLELEPNFHWSELECSDEDIDLGELIGMSKQGDNEDEV
jgi:hypothetical protein